MSSRLSNNQKWLIIGITVGFVVLPWWLWWESNKKQKAALALKQKEMDDITENNALKEAAMRRVGGEPLIRTAEAIVEMDKRNAATVSP